MTIPAGGPANLAWSPTFDQVAAHVPWLTVSLSSPGSQEYLNTFSSDTSPDDAVAAQHIAEAEAVISARVTTVPTALNALASVAAALRAAWTLASAYARTAEDRDRAAEIGKAYETATKELLEAADNAGADTLSALPVMYAPDPVPWGDDLIIGASSGYPRQYLFPE